MDTVLTRSFLEHIDANDIVCSPSCGATERVHARREVDHYLRHRYDCAVFVSHVAWQAECTKIWASIRHIPVPSEFDGDMAGYRTAFDAYKAETAAYLARREAILDGAFL